MFALVEVTVRVPDSVADDDDTRGLVAASFVKAAINKATGAFETAGLEVVSVETTETSPE